MSAIRGTIREIGRGKIPTTMMLFCFLCVEYFIPSPISSTYAYHFALQSGFAALLLGTVFLNSSANRQFPKAYLLINIAFFSLIGLTLLNTIHVGLVDAYQLRDFLRTLANLLVGLALYAAVDVRRPQYLSAITWFSIVFVGISGIVALLWVVSRSVVTFLNAYTGGNEVLAVETYWRFTGFLGNPNTNAIFVTYALLFLISVEWSSTRKNVIRWMLIALSLVNILLSSSRAVFAALLLSMVLFALARYLRIAFRGYISHLVLRNTIFAMVAVGIAWSYFLSGEQTTYLVRRIMQSFAYLENERFQILIRFVSFFQENPSILFFGTLSDLGMSGYSFTDNDYIFWTFKYGVFATTAIVVIHLYAIRVAAKLNANGLGPEDRGLAKFIYLVVPFMLIAAFAAPVWSNPQLFLFPMLLFIYALRRRKHLCDIGRPSVLTPHKATVS